MNIYDEAIEYLKNGSDDLYSYQVLQIIKALTRAKKVEELLGLYRECNKEGVFWLEIQQRIAQLEKELEELK